MRYILPSLTCLTVFWVAVTIAQHATDDPTAGDRVVSQAVQAFIDQPSLEAKVRQRATLFGKRVSAAGFFLQLRDEDRTLVRYEFKMQVGDQSRSILHVNNGTTLWLRRDLGDLKSQAYVSIRRLRQLQSEQPEAPTPPIDFESALALGGFSEVLTNLAANFQFGEPKSVELAGLPMWEVVGQWKPARLAELGGAQALPSHLPDTVKLLLGRDENFPLFPYRIMFGRRRGDSQGLASKESPRVDPLVTIELYEVRRRPDLTAADFAFQPSDQNVEDLTETYARKLGL